jgi:two-component system phosphate regulon sensor histidine kinase PhoR
MTVLAGLIAVVALIVGGWIAARRIGSLEARLESGDRAREDLASRLDMLQRQRATDLQMLNGLGEGLLGVDRQRRIAIANRRFRELFGVSNDVMGKALSEVVRVSHIFDAFDRALAGEESVERFTVQTGVSERKIEMRALPLLSENIAAAALFIDLTKIERLEQIRRNFISDFSHEVRTPLAGLRSAVETFEANAEHLSAEEDHQLRRIMTRQLRRLERLVDDLSELSRIEAGDVPLEMRSVDLRRMIDELREDFTEQAAQHRIGLTVRGDHVVVEVDPLRIQQALSNLLDNAIKYGGDGKEVTLEVIDDRDSGVVRISDQGEGIPRSERTNVFRRFYRLDKSRSQEIPGSGLGLAISKHLILQHRGSIDVESEPGNGATFIVRLLKRTAPPAVAK